MNKTQVNLELPKPPSIPYGRPNCTSPPTFTREIIIRRPHRVRPTFLKASVDIGFFYLDFRDSELGASLLRDTDELFNVGKTLFELSLEEKKKHDFSAQNSYFGYKGQGVAVIDTDGNLDRNEFYNASKDDILGISNQLPAPNILQQEETRPLLKSFMLNSHKIVTLILKILNDKLGLQPNILPNLHRQTSPSGDQVRWVKAPPQPLSDRRVALGQHTDFGSITVLMNRLGGLQVQLPANGSEGEWVYVRPMPGFAVINLGDAMVKFTNGLLRSNIHRVNAPPGAQADYMRYSLVYFARPEDQVLLRRLDGSNIPELQVAEQEVCSKEWTIRRALGRRVDLGKEIDFEKAAGTEEISRRRNLN
ncbi:Oxoglutarate/iron-dependent dioxygenase [Penicillium malachiteum]|uniref:Oxoglutarate/iron-dependent dioxygenase n=1 Tax=Penicillium malachiteum TaxID=1324776 RepID=UPI0025466B14|nr:Oxoglutarate/iron-dependent dioxygenase [Penicillium malachiteum]KAJ5721443.1 Oxoglutarate/iron-dependent dioxygenase [Penicillium malachiteum]